LPKRGKRVVFAKEGRRMGLFQRGGQEWVFAEEEISMFGEWGELN
jgi:hypothetical protein